MLSYEITAKEARQRSKNGEDKPYVDTWVHNTCHAIRETAIKGGHSVSLKKPNRPVEPRTEAMRKLGFDVSVTDTQIIISW